MLDHQLYILLIGNNMERKLVSLRTVGEVIPIEGADNIELVRIDGWQCVVKKGEFAVGDLAIYFEIDSFIPFAFEDNAERFGFLAKNKITWNGKEGARIKTIRLRGQISQGLALPVPEASEELDLSFHISQEFDGDISHLFGVEKWEPVIPAQLAGKVKGNFPNFLRKTDQERIQNIYEEVLARNDIYEVTLKMDGSSMTVYRKDGVFGVCSRNLDLIETEGNAFWDTARKLNIEQNMISLGMDNVAIQGELVGPGIQGNKEGLKELDFYVFDMFDITTGTYFVPAFRRISTDDMHLKHVPVIEYAMPMTMTLDELLAFADGPSLNSKIREGLVFKSIDNPMYSWKVISNQFLLKTGE